MLGDGYMNFTGYPSIDNIHNKDYSFFDRNPIIPDMSIYNTINNIKLYKDRIIELESILKELD